VFAVDLLWLPLGAGGHSVRLNGRVYEAAVAAWERRARCDLYHAALEVTTPQAVYAIEMAPARLGGRGDHGAVAGGAVGSRLLGRSPLFRYEVRRRPDGTIPDAAAAVGGPTRLTEDPELVRRLLELVPRVPTPVWGRDDLRAGEMWSSNSVVSWLLEASGLPARSVRLPAGGRAPGWDAGIAVAARMHGEKGAGHVEEADLGGRAGGGARVSPVPARADPDVGRNG
jgi:hypothetical protein